MGRWTQYDEDEYRLPEGMKRTGYDADTGHYFYRDSDGAIWQGAEGAEFSEMTRVSGPSAVALEGLQEEDIEAAPAHSNGYQLLSADSPSVARKYNVNADAYRTLFPFFLIIAVFLLLIWRLVLSPGLNEPVEMCPRTTKGYWVQPSDSCWDISKSHGCSLEMFKEMNPKIDCELLMPGTTVCLPDIPRPPPK